MITISLCMVVRNEAESLEKCLHSCAPVFDEIIIVDLKSTDDTVGTARRYTQNVFSLDWGDDFAAAYNYAFLKASCDYILWMDADETLLTPDLNQLRLLKKSLPLSTDIVVMKNRVALGETGSSIKSFYQERLIKRAAGYQWKGAAHPYIPLRGKIGNVSINFTHLGSYNHATLNLEIYRDMVTRGSEFTPRDTLCYARELRDNGLAGEAIPEFEKYLNLENGWIEDYLSACFELSLLYKAAGKSDETISVLLRSLKYAKPRADICTEIGEYHYAQKAYEEAVYWFNLALNAAQDFSYRLIYEDYLVYVPALQLCMCHYNLGNIKEAVKYNQIAKEVKPNDPSVINNEKFFAGLRQQKKPDLFL